MDLVIEATFPISRGREKMAQDRRPQHEPQEEEHVCEKGDMRRVV